MASTTTKPPPDAERSPGEGSVQGPGEEARYQHDSNRCRACGGKGEWNEARRNQAELEALVRGYRRICDMPGGDL